MQINISKKDLKISVVIASLGGNVLIRTLNLLNNNSLKPDEIIIVIPKENKDNIPSTNFTNVKYEFVPFRGQVAQRAYGFKLVKNDYVLQLDDDIQLDVNCLEVLLNALLSLGDGHSVGPSILFNDTKTTVYTRGKGIYKLYLNLKSYFLSGALWGDRRMGTISKSGVGFGFEYVLNSRKFNKTEWLAGGCILHFRSRLFLDNYFPFEGKAYGEDLIHSFYLNKVGINLYIINNAICFIDRPILNKQSYSLDSDFKSRVYLNKLRKTNLSYLYVWYYIRKFTTIFL